MTGAMQVKNYGATVEQVGKNYNGRYCAVTIDGTRVELRIPKGTRGIKPGGVVSVRVEWRTWFKLTRTTIKLGIGATSEDLEMDYEDGLEHPHYYLELEA